MNPLRYGLSREERQKLLDSGTLEIVKPTGPVEPPVGKSKLSPGQRAMSIGELPHGSPERLTALKEAWARKVLKAQQRAVREARRQHGTSWSGGAAQ